MNSKLSLRKKIALELFRKYRDNAKKLHQLNYIFWECTLRCNLNCLHCGSDCKKEAAVKDMPVSDFIGAIDDVSGIVEPNKTMIVLTGGEPLLRNDLEICGKQLYERGFPWGMVSNGFHLSSKRLQSLLQAGLRAVTISLDGLENSHNWLRGNPKSFENAVNAIGLLSETDDLKFDVVTCVNQKNFNELNQLKELLLSKGVKEWRLFTVFPIGRAKEHSELQLNPVQFKHLFDFIARERKKGDIKLNYGCEGFLGNYEGEVRDNLFFCRAGVNVASVLIDGSISACPNLRDNFSQGNIYKNSFKEIWENEYSIYRDRTWMKTGECSDCSSFKYCEGNGMHLRDEKTGKLLFCHLNRIKEGEEACKE
ncbi:TIGR04133 family radical SAM/SPASM protein [Labilibaculum sp. K2S]|uniref:TIGR04133 family radical SAM/SPASM protein n=1 Tax=Labilibaculum sp. K2S TaxID=3056386 RepID=UPI0025A38169|nr:TIGR04133 family radical SAM/SPASM protein [Labilibaculum sp. K2S]MDM8161709.1 TIGR04133 family radical SAM/SPASM protein [Labilibaculum sp. K2S]